MAEKCEQQASTVNQLKTTHDGVKLIPQPTDDPQDPLNWSLRTKIRTLAIVSWASCVGITQAVCHQSGLPIQAKNYGVTSTEMSYSVRPSVLCRISPPQTHPSYLDKRRNSGLRYRADLLAVSDNPDWRRILHFLGHGTRSCLHNMGR